MVTFQDNSNPPATTSPKDALDVVNQKYQDFVNSQPPLTPAAGTPPAKAPPHISGFDPGIAQFKEGLKRSGDGNIFEGGLEIGAGAVNTVLGPIAPIFAPIGAGVKFLADSINKIPGFSKFANSKAGGVAAHGVEDFGNLTTIAGAVGGGMEGADLVDKAQEFNQARLEQNLKDNALHDAMPTLSDAKQNPYQLIPVDKEGNPISNFKDRANTIPRITGEGEQTVNPDRFNLDSQAALLKSPAYRAVAARESLLGGYSARARFNAVNGELPKLNKDLITSLEQSNTPVELPKVANNVSNALDDLKSGANLGTKTKSAASVIDDFRKTVIQLLNSPEIESNTAGIIKARQALDMQYSKFKGDFPSGTETRGIGDRAYITARDSLNQQAIDAEKNIDIKQKLKDEWDLHRAADQLQNKADLEKPTVAGRFSQRHPTISRFGGYIGRRTIFRSITHP